ncbi:MAG: vitamin K epoxide reductase family protein [Vicinamibacterales bacterium]
MAIARSGRGTPRASAARDRTGLDAAIPPGWEHNPAAWSQRIPVIVLALAGFGIASYLALYQWGVFGTVWEPFFGGGSKKILNSSVSEALPIPDAALGAFTYLLLAAAGLIGSRRRWRTMPWIVVLFGLAVGPLGVVSVMLTVFQPVLYGTWCTLCLASAAISLAMVGPAMDEFLASLQHLKREHAKGRSLWRAFWGLEG